VDDLSQQQARPSSLVGRRRAEVLILNAKRVDVSDQISNQSHQWFLRNPVTPVGGVITLDDRPGLGMELDESKIEEQRTLSWTETRWS
jgi:L-alanine-DL-glutamate epimerase-like enolase superfamily enzyme